LIIYCCAKYPTFVRDYLDRFANDGHITILVEQFNATGAKGADALWCEWGDHNAVNVSLYNLVPKKILRIHRYEIFQDYLFYINYKGFDKTIFVSHFLKEYAEKKVGEIPNATVIRNGIDLDKYKFNPVENNKIGWLGYISGKKGIPMLMFIANSFPDYEFYFGGKWQMEELKQLYEERKPKNLHYEGYVDDVSDFYKDKSYVLSTSLTEGTQLSVLEGMACGCVPLVWYWVGAEEIYPVRFIYRSFVDLYSILKATKKNFERDNMRRYVSERYVSENYDINKTYREYKKILEDN
jgi:glycosyltransferase involved in cell wall biosynthesis